jgi:hypothetical protein
MAAAEVGEPAMTRLIELRQRLARLRRKRQRIRVGTALAGLAAAALLILAAAFVLDWLFEMGRIERIVLLGLCLAAGVWAFRRYFLPWVGFHETELQMALLVERQHHIDSDLIAALEFESPGAERWGSVQLEEAVIRGAASTGRQLNVMQGVSRDQLGRRSALLAACLAGWAAVAVFFPSHLLTFLSRLGLGARHYPTATVIEALSVNGRKVDPLRPAATPVKVFFGQPARFQVTTSGKLPDEAYLVLSGERSGQPTRIDLVATADQPHVFAAEWPRPTENVRYQVFCDKAWTDPGRLEVTDLPVVEFRAEVIPPMYAGKGSGRVELPAGLMQFSVIEGSQVILRLVSDKYLKQASVKIGEQSFPLRRDESHRREDGRDPWVFDDADSPLGRLAELTRFSIQVEDGDGQELDRAKEGLIRIQIDGPPRIAAAAVTRYVLPTTGRPTVYFRAVDDYGIGRIDAIREIVRNGGEPEQSEVTIYSLPSGEKPQRNLESNAVIDFATIKPAGGEGRLVKGDTVKITLRAVDFRGRHEGKIALTEPLVFQVTDEAGLLANTLEADKVSVQQLKAMIQRQLGIGDSP